MGKYVAKSEYVKMVQYVERGLATYAIAETMGLGYLTLLGRFNCLGGYRRVKDEIQCGRTPEEIVNASAKFAPKPSPVVQLSLPVNSPLSMREGWREMASILYRMHMIVMDEDPKALEELYEAVFSVPVGVARKGAA